MHNFYHINRHLRLTYTFLSQRNIKLVTTSRNTFNPYTENQLKIYIYTKIRLPKLPYNMTSWIGIKKKIIKFCFNRLSNPETIWTRHYDGLMSFANPESFSLPLAVPKVGIFIISRLNGVTRPRKMVVWRCGSGVANPLYSN